MNGRREPAATERRRSGSGVPSARRAVRSGRDCRPERPGAGATSAAASASSNCKAACGAPEAAVSFELTDRARVKKKVMAKALVVVESPAKAKTINKYLGRDFKVVASMGHIRDLPKSKLGVDVDNDFEEQYESLSIAQEGHQGAEGRGEGRERHLRRDRPRPRGRSHRLAPGARARRPEAQDSPADVQRDHEEGRSGGVQAPQGDRHADGGRAARPPRPRSARRLQDQPAAVGQGPARAERRSRPVGRAQAGMRPRARNREVRPGRVLESLRTAGRSAAAGVRSEARRRRAARTSGWPTRSSRTPSLADLERAVVDRVVRHDEGAEAARAGAVHHEQAPADGAISRSRRR